MADGTAARYHDGTSSSPRSVSVCVRNQIVFVDPAFQGKPFDADLVDLRRNPFALQHRRHYQFASDGTLTLSARYDTGKDAAVGRWKKSS